MMIIIVAMILIFIIAMTMIIKWMVFLFENSNKTPFYIYFKLPLFSIYVNFVAFKLAR